MMPTDVGDDGAMADDAWERVVELLQATLAGAVRSFEASLETQGAATSQEAVESGSIEALLSAPEFRADVHAVCAAGDGGLLEEVTFDLTLEDLRRKAAPRFWASVCPSLAEGGDTAEVEGTSAFSSTRHSRALVHSLGALQQLRRCHEALLLYLGTPGSAEVAQRYRTTFRATLMDKWPSTLSDVLLKYCGWTWKRHKHLHRASRANAATSMDVVGDADEEWWWASKRGQACSEASRRRGREHADRVLTLLDSKRRPTPSTAALSGAAADGDVDMISGVTMDSLRPSHGAGTTIDGCQEVESAAAAGLFHDDDAHEDEEDDADACSLPEEDAGESADAGAAADLEADVAEFRQVACTFRALDLADVWRDLVMQFLTEELANSVEERCAQAYDAKGLLRHLTASLYGLPLRWLRAAHGLSSTAPRHICAADFPAEDSWWIASRRIVLRFFEAFMEVRIRGAFDMVRDFPESAPALIDLRRCLTRTGQSAPLVSSLRKQLAKRLLIAGAPTSIVIEAYIKTIKAMRLVDPRGLLLEAVSSPIRAYLRGRKDTVRCIVTALTGDSDLQVELQSSLTAAAQAKPAQAAQAQASNAPGPATGAAAPKEADASVAFFGEGLSADVDMSDEEEDPDSWVPDPMDADPFLPSRRRRAQDIISLLVGIYGSKEMLIKEYKEMLADRLLGNPSYGTEKETRNLELMKTRFGEASLAHCEVMLQDVKDSKRTNANVQQRLKNQAVPVKLHQLLWDPPVPPVPQEQRPPQAHGFQPPPRSAQRNPAGDRPVAYQDPAAAPPGPPRHAVTASTQAASAGTALLHGQQSRVGPEQIQALILSQHYWPAALSKADHPQFKLPEPLEQALSEYSTAYQATRAKRTLNWKRSTGLVEVTIELEDRSLNVSVTPVHLAVLACFNSPASAGSSPSAASHGLAAPTPVSETPTPSNAAGASNTQRLSLQQVASALELPETVTRKRLGFWLSKGVLREVRAGIYEVQESLSQEGNTGFAGAPGASAGEQAEASGHHMDGDHLDDQSPGMQSGGRPVGGGDFDLPCAQEVKTCEAFIKGMLTNHQALPVGRIHHFLSMYMREPLYTQTEARLRMMLARMCEEGRLEFDGSNYSLAKTG
eukprot:TRINITY_DN110959_c0_g1_i1.p1 TRINITY_DN110959_c0_g1~~TRINITY_DN110959_c0_g1_i1.p1  ORF type:complete len:1117 (+),score=226.83 TRINITY_DN110959_c0_g1_i1:194-3544(+)